MQGDTYHNTLGESVIGLYKTEVFRRRPWCKLEGVEFAPLEWVWWFNEHRLLGPLGHVPLVGYEESYDRAQEDPPEPLRLNPAALQ